MYVALDLSVKSTGYAFWSEDQAQPVSGVWKLAPDLSWAARAFVRLHQNLMDLHRVTRITRIRYELPLDAGTLGRPNNPAIPFALIGLAAHVESFGEAIGCAHDEVHQATWRRHFLGPMKRGTKKVDLKAMAMERCRQLGLSPINNDAAEALGILDYMLSVQGITPPWRMANPLVGAFGLRPGMTIREGRL